MIPPGQPADSRVLIHGDRHRRKLIRAIEDRLVDLETTSAPSIEIQPLIQLTAGGGYPAWRAATEKAWRKKRAPASTHAWPDTIADDTIAALVIPVSAGRVGIAFGKHPRPLLEPAFVTGTLLAADRLDDPALAVAAHWFAHIAQPRTLARPEPRVRGGESAKGCAAEKLDIPSPAYGGVSRTRSATARQAHLRAPRTRG